ncbi:MAG: serine/threonine-protein kinase, partial [Gemmataceae bacterium]
PEERLDSADMLLQQLDLIRGSRENGLSVRDLPTAASPEPVEFTEGGVSDYRTEMRDLLRQRLRALSLIAVLVSLWMMVVNDFWRMAPGLLSFRLALLGVAIGAYAVLASKLPLSTRRLHRLGLVLLASICVVLVVVPSENMLTAAEKGQDSLAAAQRVMFMATWSILILGHALFIPSTWKRAALTLFLLAIFAKINIVVLAHMSADLRRAWDIPIFQIIVEMPIIAAAIGTYAVYLLNQLRYQAFQAQLLGQYVLKEKIGAGPVGEVFRGEHYYLKRPCAIKLIRPGPDIDADTLARFEKAIQFTNTITDPGVVLVYDYGRSRDGALYCVMELLPGMSAAQIVEEFGPLPPARVAHVLQQASSALGEAHAIGFFHRNLKPGNLMLSQAGRTHDSVKLLDFGLNREISGKHVPPDAALYASPEQATDEPFNASSDVYELGAVAYYLLTGKPVFMTSNPL